MKSPGFGAARLRQAKAAEDVAAKPLPPQALNGKLSRSRKGAQASRSRASRAQAQRANEELHPKSDTPWAPGASLEAPPARPGYRQKWLRVSIFGRDDVRNVARQFREGWMPRPADTTPKNLHVPRINGGQFAGCIGVEGMVLCEIPERMAEQRNRHYRRKAEALAQDIEKNIASINRKVPQHAGFGRLTKTETTRVVRPAPVDTGEDIEA